MPEPIDYLALVDLRDAMQAITIAGGYHHDVAAGAVHMDPNCDLESLLKPGGARPFVFVQVLPYPLEFVEHPRGMKVPQLYRVHWVNDTDPTDDTSFIKAHLRACADIERAIANKVFVAGIGLEANPKDRDYAKYGDSSQCWTTFDVEIPVFREFGSPNGV